MRRMMCIILAVAIALVLCVGAFAEGTTYTELAKGSKGDEVKDLQTRLTELGYYSSSIDGDYGNGTVKAVSAFQSRNGLEADGTATVEVLELLYSDNAKVAPFELEVYPSKVKLTSTELSYTIKNKTSEEIDNVRSIYILYGSDGSIVSDQMLSYDKNYLTKDWGYADAIASVKSRTDCYNDADGCFGWAMSVAQKGVVAVISYHKTSGSTVYISPDQIMVYDSDGNVQFPEDDVEPYEISDAEAAELAQIKLGYVAKNLYPWTAEFYSVDEGLYLLEVQPGSIADKAGFKAGDIITSIDGARAIEVKSTYDAQRKLLNGESVEFTYSRNGVANTVTVSTDMEAVASETASSTDEATIGEELLRYGELLEKGLITQEEYDILKQKLING